MKYKHSKVIPYLAVFLTSLNLMVGIQFEISERGIFLVIEAVILIVLLFDWLAGYAASKGKTISQLYNDFSMPRHPGESDQEYLDRLFADLDEEEQQEMIDWVNRNIARSEAAKARWEARGNKPPNFLELVMDMFFWANDQQRDEMLYTARQKLTRRKSKQ